MRRVLGGRGSVVHPVLGFGGTASVLAGGHPSDGVSPAHRRLRKRWKRRGRARDLRSLLLRGHGVDDASGFGEAGEERARANAGSDPHNLDAPPTWRAKDVGVDGVPREHLWDRSPFRCPVRGRREHGEQIEASTRAVYPGSGRDGRVKPYSCLVVLNWGARELGELATPSVWAIWIPSL